MGARRQALNGKYIRSHELGACPPPSPRITIALVALAERTPSMTSPFEEKEVELTPEQKELHAKVEKYEVRMVIAVAIPSHPLSAAISA